MSSLLWTAEERADSELESEATLNSDVLAWFGLAWLGLGLTFSRPGFGLAWLRPWLLVKIWLHALIIK